MTNREFELKKISQAIRTAYDGANEINHNDTEALRNLIIDIDLIWKDHEGKQTKETGFDNSILGWIIKPLYE